LHMNRRHILAATAATAVAACTKAGPMSDATAQLNTAMDAMFNEVLDASPQTATQLGLDKDARAAAKSKLDDVSLGGREHDKALVADQLKRLKAIDRKALTGIAAVNHDTLVYVRQNASDAYGKYAYGYGTGGPYVLSQLGGSYQSDPDFLGTQHTIETKADADAYLARLSAFGDNMDAEIERARRDVDAGVIPPDFIIDKTLTQMNGLLGRPEASPLVTSVADRAKAKGIEGDYAGQAAKLYADKIVPALNRQIEFMKAMRPKATHDAGVWRLPDGGAYYADSLRDATTTTLSPDEIHQMGLDQQRELSSRADELLKGQGLTQGAVGERIQALYKDKRYLYANTDAAKEKMIADLNAQVKAMTARLPQYFGHLPKAAVEVRRVPKFIEAGAPGGYYNTPSLDGSRPGIYWINLRDTAENPTWTLPTLTAHEAVPGHHNQLALQQETNLPKLRQTVFFSAFGEGWALYAEQLAKEMGVYENDPLGEIGYLQSSLFRAARLVVDTGLHFKRWSREQAIATMRSIDGRPESAATTEIERYCVWPGQACSYMVGKLTWLRVREKAKASLGSGFDIHQFHDAGLLIGAVPLTVLETAIDDWVAGKKKG
jgi:uncharacterized protein (DUF885 family)